MALLVSGIVLPGGAGAWAAYLQATGNIHEVVPGLLFRSNQLRAAQLQTLLQDEGIRTVINLRGGSRQDDWYREEADVVAGAGARLVDIPIADDKEPDITSITRLLAALRTSPTPVLIHCKAGADRTGLAAALYLLEVAGLPPDVAARHLSFAYGHFPWLGSQTGAMDRAFWGLVDQSSGSTGS
ncbi:tyrosine-protein phosphatase [Devosia sp.]|uniref:tyrosine-protein phosphatase n=1 Tax=Devosia sp. TaxID=1871048 RepID=UPI0019F0AEE7|nr:tyrosine-protein phosphatase [Devosia sp.]MBE0581920.1 tyrosine-protein phosphatase [Devosia sp.]